MLRQVETDELLLPAQPLPPRNLLAAIEELDRFILRHREEVEQRRLPGRNVALMALPVLQGNVQGGQQGSGRPQRGNRVGLDERLHDPLVDGVQVHPLAEIGQGAERARLLSAIADGNDRLDRSLAHVLDGGQAKADRLGGARRIGLDREEGR